MNDLTLLDGGNVPAHVAARFAGSQNTDLSNGVSPGGYPILSFKGKAWHIVEGDKRVLVTGPDGEPKLSLEVVMLKANPNLSKLYYATGYVEGSNEKPTCYSNDAIAPAADAAVKQCGTCAACPHNIFGSKISENGAKGKACADTRRMAVAPVGQIDKPMLLRVPAGSLKDLTVYGQKLDKMGAPYQALVTKISFDHTVAHQKLVFTPVRWLSDDEANNAVAAMDSDIIPGITGYNPAAVPTAPETFEIAGTPPATVTAPVQAPPTPPAPKPEPTPEPVIRTMFETGADDRTPAEVRAAKVLTDASASLDDVMASLDD